MYSIKQWSDSLFLSVETIIELERDDEFLLHFALNYHWSCHSVAGQQLVMQMDL